MENQIQQNFYEIADQLIGQLTLEEKIGMIHGNGLFRTQGVKRLGIPPLIMSDGPMGVRNEFHNDTWIPIDHSDDFVTYLPCNTAIAATWNRQLAYQAGHTLGEEARGRGKDIILAPGINIKRSPLCGRNFEYFSEDPFLTKEMAVPYIKGVQESDVAACVKHFAVNNQETKRLSVDVEVEERALREIYLPAFYASIFEANSYTLMGSYNKLYGEHCSHSSYLLNEILRKEWNYDGVIISDWGAVHNTKEAALSGLDIEMSVTNNFDDYFLAAPLKKEIELENIPITYIDKKVKNILVLMMRLNMLGGVRKAGCYNTHQHRITALETARESIVLLKNENNRLPLKKDSLKKVLVIGENAECLHAHGGGSAEIKALYEISPLMGLKSQLGGNTEITYVKGYIRDEQGAPKEDNWQAESLEQKEVIYEENKLPSKDLLIKREQLRREALKLANEFEQVIFFGGLNHELDVEGSDRKDMKLPYEQDQLIEELLKINPNTVIVIIAGAPVEMSQWIDRAQAVVYGWYAGMEGGNAMAEVLLGEINPSGKLAESFPKSHCDCSAHALGEFPGEDKVKYQEGIFVGYRYYDTFHVEPAFCFGHGMSYTEFSFRDIRLDKGDFGLTVSCNLKNCGMVAGAEVVQVYMAPMQKADEDPVQELKGFSKIFLEPNEEKEITIIISQVNLTRFNTITKEIVTISGEYEIRVGASSRDIRVRKQIIIDL